MQPATREYYNLSELWGGRTVPRRHASLAVPIGLWRSEPSGSSANF
jgi:hypothetical protein